MSESFIIAIDFGTAYSGYAFSLTAREAEIDPYVKYWGEEVGQRTVKTPTCILFDEHEGFMSFGYEAQRDYHKMRGEEAQHKFFFQSFKMSLYGRKLDDDVTIPAANGKPMKALKVFTEALRYMKDDALKTINNMSGRVFNQSDFCWVLTVPAIWGPSAKQFMRRAATQAGIVTAGKEDRLVIALETEAASVWCRKLPADGFIAENQGEVSLDQSPGTQYIVVDCGGGTIDVTVHEVLDGGALKELHKASGNNMGGQSVDRKFKEFLKEIFGDALWEKYEREHPGELQKMMYQFTLSKRHDDEAVIICPFNLTERARDSGKDMETLFKGVRGASWYEGSIQISKERMRSFFDDSLRGITNLLKEILKKDFHIDYILLVGGYSESETLRQHVINQIKGQCKVLCPLRPQEAIMMGAVLFGRNPAVVASRKSAFTYGVKTIQTFDPSKHREDKKFIADGIEKCGDLFYRLVEIDEDVGWAETRDFSFVPTASTQTAMSFSFFRTERKNPQYVDEWGVEEIGSMKVSMPDTTRGRDRRVKLQIKFGFTEMKATATDEDSGCTESVELDFMRTS
ncbi:heat shock 70 kDa protein 12A-like [Salarias fasciatus]|uniref:heat shock 70 kDa protein 12A-like n=1 Tax=Salarias fasciatus TaxID=181472 RepID=UPI0011768E2C|nr:heat shock 70 kDa protein 12A-like [Salarias fasciatus]